MTYNVDSFVDKTIPGIKLVNPYNLKRYLVKELIDKKYQIEGIYFIFDNNDQFIYVGQSSDIIYRLKQHCDINNNICVDAKEVKKISYIEIDLFRDRDFIEAIYIKVFKPKFNELFRIPRINKESLVADIYVLKQKLEKARIEQTLEEIKRESQNWKW